MKKIIIGSLACVAMLYATNGDNLIGLGAKSRAMGGVGIATYFGAENTLSNPALISNAKGGEVSFGATYFAPNVKAYGTKSSADKNVIPEVSISEKINDSFSYGIGMFGSAGMGVDYRNSSDARLMKARTNLLLMKFAPAIAYKYKNFSFGFAPVMQYGSLDISYNSTGRGSSDDFGIGFEAGIAYTYKNNLRVGFVYKSPIDMNYDHQLKSAANDFGIGSYINSDHLEQPAEYGIGISYSFLCCDFSFDYKTLKWSSAKGYGDFGWKDQDVYAMGIKYEKDGTWYAVGFNYAKNPITKDYGGAFKTVFNTLNYLMFPATSEKHYSIGAGTRITKHLSVDFDIVYSPKKSIDVNTITGSMNIEHSESSVAFSMRYSF